MAEIRHLQNAPITEALIDFRVKNSNIESLERSLDTLKEMIGFRYPKFKAAHGFQAEFHFRAGNKTEHSAEEVGFQGFFCESEDGLNIVQFRTDGFTFNRLRPYTSWKAIVTEAMNLWALYVKVAEPEYVTRLALRYINQLKLPRLIDDFSRYLTSLPDVPKDTFYHLRGFLIRLLVLEPKLNLEAVLTQALELNIDPNSTIIFIDIEAFKQKEFSPQDEAIMTTLEALRDVKNTIFFGSITEETVRLFNGS